MTELQQFFHMGGYAWYVWPSFLLTAVVLLGNTLYASRELKNSLKQAQMQSERERTRQRMRADKKQRGDSAQSVESRSE